MQIACRQPLACCESVSSSGREAPFYWQCPLVVFGQNQPAHLPDARYSPASATSFKSISASACAYAANHFVITSSYVGLNNAANLTGSTRVLLGCSIPSLIEYSLNNLRRFW